MIRRKEAGRTETPGQIMGGTTHQGMQRSRGARVARGRADSNGVMSHHAAASCWSPGDNRG